MLRFYYLSQDPEVIGKLRSLPRPQISFNYLGQFGHVLPKGSMFRPARESTGATHGPLGGRRYLVEVRAGIYEDRLQVDWIYSRNVHRHETIDRLAQVFTDSLRAIIRHCCSVRSGGHTPSDFPLARLDQHQLDELLSVRTDVDEIYPLAPMQSGMLFHTLYAPESAAYCVQISCIRGTLDATAFARAWERAVHRYPPLRTTFACEHGGEELQIVHHDVALPITSHDWRHLSSSEQATELEAFRRDDLRRPFDRALPPLFRLSLFQVDDEQHECVWTYQHLVLDGWSAYLVLRDVFAFYEASCDGVELHPTRIRRSSVPWFIDR